MRASLSAELLKLRKRPAVWVVGAVFVLLSLFAFVFPYLSYQRGAALGGARSAEELLEAALPASLVPSALSAWPLLGGAVALVFGVLLAGSEYSWDTLKTVLTQRPGRAATLAGKATAAAILTAVAVVTSVAVDALASLAHYLPGTNAGAVVAALGEPTEQQGRGNPGVTDAAGGTQAVLVTAGYLVTLATATGVVLRRRDIT
jgi:ABC-type transport system involved in multi-copper enzyme maturation permease subunit